MTGRISPRQISLQPVRIDTGSRDEEGFLVFADGRLIAVLVRLEDEEHGPVRGKLFLETGFGAFAATEAVYFDDPDRARAWFATRHGQIGEQRRG